MDHVMFVQTVNVIEPEAVITVRFAAVLLTKTSPVARHHTKVKAVKPSSHAGAIL